jgi:hypothetical protein
MSKLSRRALIGSASSLPALAIPAASLAAPANPRNREAIFARAEQMVEILRDRFVCEGWHEGFDQQRASEFLDSVRQQDYSAEDDPKLATITTWVSDHGQSLDWLYCGDPSGLISKTAARSRSAAAIPAAPDPIFALIEQHRLAYRACDDLPGEIPDDLSEHLRDCAVQVAATKPTTSAGVVAVMRYYRELQPGGYHLIINDESMGEAADPRCGMTAWFALIEGALEDIAGRSA